MLLMVNLESIYKKLMYFCLSSKTITFYSFINSQLQIKMKTSTFKILKSKTLSLAILVVLIGLFLNQHALAQVSTIDFGKSATKVEVAKDKMDQLNLNFSFSGANSFTVETEKGLFNELAIPGTYTIGKLGTPKLPASKKLIEIPFGAEVSVEVKSFSVTEYKLADFGIMDAILPMQPPVRKDQDASEIPFEYDKEVYRNNQFIEPELATVEVLGVLRGYRMARVTVAPVSYNPVKGIIRVCNNIEVEISFNNPDESLTQYIKNSTYSPYFKVIENSLINRLGGGYPEHPDLTKYPVKYLIVANRMFEDDLQSFVEWKTMKGFKVILAYTDEIGTSFSQIQSYVHDQYNQGTPEDPAPSFVLFVGDTPQIPASMGSQSSKMTDLYYASVDGDYFPEMYYGRFSATNSAELLTQIAKTVYYEKYEFIDPSYLNDVTLIAGADGTWNPRIGQATVHYGTENYFNTAHGFANVNAYLNSYSGCYDPDRIAVSMINYTAHCNETVWGDPLLTQSNVNAFANNGKYPIAVGNCCLAADFGYDECMGETWQRGVNKGSVAYIGSSPSSYWFEDFYWAVGAFPVQGNNNGYVPTYDETTWGAYDAPFVSDYITTGSTVFVGNLAVTEVHTQGYPSHSSPTYYWQAYNVLGDPSLVPYYTEGENNNVSHMAILPIGLDYYEVTAEAGSYVAISKDGVLHGAALVGESGVVEVSIDPVLASGDVNIVVTKPQYIPYMTTIPAAALEGAFVVKDSYLINDVAGGNGNGMMDYNESILISLSIKNVGVDAAENIVVSISSEDEYVTITDSEESYGDIDPDEVVMVDDGFALDVAENIPDGHVVSIEVLATDGTESWTSTLSISGHAPVLSFNGYSVDDSNGNNNGFLDPGETVEMTIGVVNSGSADAFNVIASLVSSDPLLIVETTEPQVLGNLEATAISEAVFTVTADDNIVPGYMGELELMLSADFNISGQGTVVIPFTDYCEASTSNEDEYIAHVSFGEIDNASGWQGGVANYTDMTTTLEPGVAQTITIENGNAWSSDKVTAWIDWNMDKELGNNANEIYVLTSSNSGQTFSGNITPPANQQGGQYRLRIRMTYSSTPEPCDNSSYGEVEDYTVLIPMALTANFNCDITEVCEGNQVNFSDNSSGNVLAWSWVFEGGSPATSTEENPTVTYNNVGSYDVTLTVTDQEGSSTMTHDDLITVVALPEVDLGEDITICVNHTTILDATTPGAISYLWTPGNYTTPSIEIDSTGVGAGTITYTCVVSVASDCDGEASVNVTFDPCTGFEEYSDELILSIFPNPASKVLNINLTGASESVEYTLLNYQGSQVYSQKIGQLNGLVTHQLNIDEYASGIYYLRLKTNDEIIIRKVVIK